MEEEQQEKIELYLAGKLDNESQKEFEQEIEDNASLKRRVAITGDVNDRFDDALFAQKLGQIAAPLNQKYIDRSSGSFFFDQYKWWLIGIVGICLASLLFWMNRPASEKQLDEKEVFAMYYQPYEPSFTDRSSTAEENVQTILEYYKNEKYQEAIPLIEPLLDIKPINQEWYIILGNCLLNTNDEAKALEVFAQLKDNEEDALQEIGLWYTALIHIKNEQTDLAKANLEQLATEQSGKYPKLAKELLSKLD